MFYAEYLIESEWGFPDNWAEQIALIADRHGHSVFLDGSHATSRETSSASGIEIRVLTGGYIKKYLQWLYAAYKNQFLELARCSSGLSLKASPDVESSINVNLVEGRGRRYEWHVDSNPVTGLLFVNTLEKRSGGDLVFQLQDHTKIVSPRRGVVCFFDAQNVPHSVAPILDDSVRISVPMNYYHAETNDDEIRRIVPYDYAMRGRGIHGPE